MGPDNQQLYELLFERSSDMAWILKGARFVSVNPAAARTLGFESPREIEGLTPWDISPDTQPDGASSREKAEEFVDRACRDGCVTFEWVHQKRDGTPVVCEVTLTASGAVGDRTLLAVARDTSERREAEAKLRESEERYRELVQNAASIILRWNRDGVVMFLNEFGQEFFGYSESEIIGRNVVGTIVPETETSGRDLVALMNRIRSSPQRFETNINENIRKNGERVWIAWTNKLSFDETGQIAGMLSVGVDITELRKTQRALIESERRYEAIFNSSADAFILYDLDGYILHANPVAYAMHGCSEGEFIGRLGQDFIAPEHRHLFEKLRKTRAGEWIEVESVHVRRDGTVFDADVHATRLQYGGVEQLLAAVRDVTDVRRAEQEKRQFYRDTVSSVTNGKLQMVGPESTRPYEADSEIRIRISGGADCAPARRAVSQYLERAGLSGDALALFMIGLGEAMTNAVKHAGGGEVFAGHDEQDAWAGVSDKGRGIPALTLPKATLLRGYSTKVSLGMGYTIILDVADGVSLSTEPEGTTVVLFKNPHRQKAELTLDSIPDTWDSINTENEKSA